MRRPLPLGDHVQVVKAPTHNSLNSYSSVGSLLMPSRAIEKWVRLNAISTECSVIGKGIGLGIHGLQLREKSFAAFTLFGSDRIARPCEGDGRSKKNAE